MATKKKLAKKKGEKIIIIEDF